MTPLSTIQCFTQVSGCLAESYAECMKQLFSTVINNAVMLLAGLKIQTPLLKRQRRRVEIWLILR